MRIVLALMPLLAIAASAPSFQYQLDGAHSQVKARVSYFAIGSKTASFPAMRGSIQLAPGNLEAIDLEVELDARALNAGSADDTRYLQGKDFFDVARHPLVRFSGHRMTMTGPTTARIEGQLTARGVTRPAQLAVTFRAPPVQSNGRDPIDLSARTVINRRDFGMTAYALVIGRNVTITINARMVPG